MNVELHKKEKAETKSGDLSRNKCAVFRTSMLFFTKASKIKKISVFQTFQLINCSIWPFTDTHFWIRKRQLTSSSVRNPKTDHPTSWAQSAVRGSWCRLYNCPCQYQSWNSITLTAWTYKLWTHPLWSTVPCELISFVKANCLIRYSL